MATRPAPKKQSKTSQAKFTDPASSSTASATSSSTSTSPLRPKTTSALDRFCNDLTYEDISFDSWQNTLDDLDLTVPLWLSAEAARLGGEFRPQILSQYPRHSIRACAAVNQVPLLSPFQPIRAAVIAWSSLNKATRSGAQSGKLIVLLQVKSVKP